MTIPASEESAREEDPADQAGADSSGSDSTEEKPGLGARAAGWAQAYGARFSFTGMVVAAALGALSLSPSLLPRGPLFQGIVTGGSAALGYGVGVFLMWFARFMVSRTEPWPHRPRSWWTTLAVVDIAALAGMTIGFAFWQRDLRGMMGVEQLPPSAYPMMFLLELAFFALFMAFGQGWGALVRMLSRWFSRWLPRRIAAGLGGLLVVTITIMAINGVVFDRLMGTVRSAFENINDEYEPTEAATPSAFRSGGPNSQVTWSDLGMYGRNFVAYAPTVEKLTEFNGAPATEPIRAYAGLYSAPDIEENAEVAAAELERLGGLKRKVVGVGTSTGRGWVNEVTMSSLDYMYNGDTAMVSLQYSTLPSFLSFLLDQDRARRAGLALFEAVDRRINALPPEERPKVVVFGESLGTFGGEAAFGSIGSMVSRTDGALFAGPTFGNTIWGDLVENRDAGSPMWRPVYRKGEHVRFGAGPADLRRVQEPWHSSRVVYVQHPSDPVTWFSPKLLFQKPDWLKGERGPDVLPAMRWIPIVSFLQVAADLAVAGNVSDGHGHVYIEAIPYAWDAILQPEGWDDEKSRRLGGTLQSHTDG
ncbi:MAG: alpha/beta-hydrolase family protein [Gordonia sp. (in: high G+C Gram-positive bacteria)]|uniref:alpha/beta hydrolase n=1 Tax=Gordonia sp. (in: high G+C Gram-positive bacteria) TaxID=84139 RepID=UPI0039E4E9C8